MALTGNCSWTTYSQHATETTSETITYPDDHPDSTLAGTTETVDYPVTVATTTDYTGVYLCVTQVDNINHWTPTDSAKHIIFHYAAYSSASARNADATDYLFAGNEVLEDYNLDNGVYAQIYAQLKAKEGFTNLIDD